MDLAVFTAICFIVSRLSWPVGEELSLLALTITLAMTIPGLPQNGARRISLWAIGVLASFCLHIALYQKLTGLSFSFFQVIENPVEALTSVVFYAGEAVAVAVLVEFIVTAYLLAWVIQFLSQRIRVKTNLWRRIMFGMVFIPALVFAADLIRYRTAPLNPVALEFAGGDSTNLPQSDESLIVLQLESLNGLVLFNGQIELPGLKKLEQLGGTWIPHFWSNSFGTNLGMSSILCGASGAMTAQLVSPTDGTPCMPERFKRSGYGTTFYYSYREANFYKMLDHVKKLGFDNFHYGENLMKPGDPYWKWGYDDCRFFDRAFDDMRSTGLDQKKKQFIYMSVHMNHVPYAKHLPIDHPFAEEKTPEQNYLNSAYEQDYCLAHFLKKVESLKRDDLHVLIVGDHSYPVDHDVSVFRQYTTSFYFLPSAKRREEFVKGALTKISAAQDQIVATVMEILGGQKLDTSFAWALRGEPEPTGYRKCPLISYFGQEMAFTIRDNVAIKYHVRKGEFHGTHLKEKGDEAPVELTKPSDWARYPLPPECTARLGAPKIF